MSEKVTITIDGYGVYVREGEILLWAALDNGIYIPHLCAMREHTHPFAACRLCFVEIEGKSSPVTACTEKVYEGMTVKTRSEQVDELVKNGFELIMSHHYTDCKNCPGNGSCELQKISKERKLPLRPKKLPKIEVIELQPDDTRQGLIYDPKKCVLCGQCITACKQEGAGVLNFAYRGINRVVTTFGDIPLGETECIGCGACVKVCPVGARSSTEEN